MEELKIDGNWNIKKGLIKERFQNISYEDLEFDIENTDQFLENLSRKTGLTKGQLVEQINKF
ncbi:hypothetical protein MASR2M47_31950 [Draconibacterium sp.]|jgi:uncharacterized protein YidB (DUF937 family)